MSSLNSSPTEADKQALVARLADARNELLSLVRTIPAERIETPGAVGDWSVKDLIGHIASWEDRLLTLAQMVLNGHADKIEWIGSDEALQAWNHKQYLRKRAWTWDETIRDLALMREEVLWNIGWTAPEQLFQQRILDVGAVSAAGLLEGIVEHDQEHVAQLRAWQAP
ncbi:MAG TPA: DinB family protein [Anaerolineae bacterium]|nr:DinB family protein [Anaerolineae bacterium]